MKYLAFIAIFLLAGCFGPSTLDTTSQESIKSSAKDITAVMTEQEREQFSKALMYFSVGGRDGLSSIIGTLAGNNDGANPETVMTINLQSLDGLTGQEVLAKYRAALAKDKEVKEQREAEKETIRQLSKEAKNLLESNRFEEALKKYEDLSKIESAEDMAKNGINDTKTALSIFTEKMEYMDSVVVTEFVAKRIETYSDKNVPAIRVSLKNNGERSLDKVKVTVYFQNKSGETIYEESFHPILVSRYAIHNNKPLKAGYVYEMEDGKYFTLKTKLSDWDESKTIIKIVDLEFTS